MTDLLGLTLVIHPYSNNYDEEDFFLVMKSGDPAFSHKNLIFLNFLFFILYK